MAVLTYDENGFATESGMEACYCCDIITGEYIGVQDQYVSVNCGLPAHAYIDAPPKFSDGEWPARLGRDHPWVIMPDLRGKTAYNIETKAEREIKTIGALSDDETLLKPASIHDSWDGKKWQHDADAEAAAALATATATRYALLVEANQHIDVLSDAVDLGMATEGEKDAYNAWRRYRVELTRLDLTVIPIVWPEKPQ